MALAMLALNLPRSGLVQHIIGADKSVLFYLRTKAILPLNLSVGRTNLGSSRTRTPEVL